jgi:cation transport ATPase
MFRTIRDLLLRPGYMIRDYLRGMQMAYFPPFKMFFLITALSLVIDSGLNIRGMNRQEHREEETEELFGVESSSESKGNSEEIEAKTKQAEVKDNKEQASEEKKDKVDREYERMKDGVNAWLDNESNSSYVVLMLLLYSFPLWLLIRRCPAIPDFRFSECFVAMVFIINMLTIYTLIPQFMCVSYKTEMIFSLTVTLLMIVPVKQLSGYSYWQAVWRMFVALILAFIMALVLYVFFFLMLNIYADIKYG